MVRHSPRVLATKRLLVFDLGEPSFSSAHPHVSRLHLPRPVLCLFLFDEDQKSMVASWDLRPVHREDMMTCKRYVELMKCAMRFRDVVCDVESVLLIDRGIAAKPLGASRCFV